MKLKPVYLFFTVLILTAFTYGQDFNLTNPTNELYLYSAYDEGANAFRYNPAVLGLGHRLNVTINAFIRNLRGKIFLSEGELLFNSGSLGLGYRHANDNSSSSPRQVNQYSLGLGFGNKSVSAGIVFEALSYSRRESTISTASSRGPGFKIGAGFLFRPASFISAAFTLKTGESLAWHRQSALKYTLGLGIRPLYSDILTLMTDFSIAPYSGSGIFKYSLLKAGVSVKVTNGLYINGNYSLANNPEELNTFSVGLRFDMPHSSIRYNNNFSRTNNDGFYSEQNPFRSQGNQLSLTFSAEKRKSIVPEKKKIIEITLSGSLQDYNTEDVFFGLLGKGKRSVHEVIADIDYAAADPAVKGMLLKIYPLSTGRFEVNAAIEELTRSLERFKAKGKTITAYFPQDAGPGEYYISTYADNIVLPPEALFFYGLSIEVMNYNQFLKKYGIELQTFYAGKYKLTFQGLLDSTTEEGKEVINRVLDIVYDKMMKRVTEGRKITIDDYMRDKLSQPMSGSEALRLGLVDKLGWYEDAKQLTSKNAGTQDMTRVINRSVWDEEWSEPERIAIIGVYASITTGESQPPPPVTLPIPFIGGGRTTGSETVVRQLEDAFSNPKVKAVILRVDSGGGSALGSAEINAAIIRLKKKYKKPLYVSMGGAAASGGYYVSTPADKIFADDLTITGSIGVFTARPNLDSLVKGQRVKVEIFKRGENSDIGSFFKKLDEKEIEIIQGIIDYYYERFITAVSEGREMTEEEAEQVAQGRVWLGSDAFNKNLVDEIGGLYEAIKYAKKETIKSDRYKLVYYSVPGGNTINDIVTSSVIQYLQSNLSNLLEINADDDGLEIKY